MRRNEMKKSSSGQRRSLFVRAAAVIIALCMIAALALPALAADTEDESTAGSDTYQYTVRLFAGNKGKFADDKSVVEYKVTPGEMFEIDWQKLVTVTDSRYHATGFRPAGKDNNLVTNKKQENPFKVDSDMDFVVSYALDGSDVSYTINYLKEGAKETDPPLHDPVTYYGNEGEDTVPIYIYIDGYVPKDPVTTATKLKEGTTFTCYYTKIASTNTPKAVTNEGSTTTTTKSGSTTTTKKNSNSTTTTTTTKRTTTTTTKRTTTTTRRVGTASSSSSTLTRSSGSTSSNNNPTSTTTTTRNIAANPTGTTATGNSAGTTPNGNNAGTTTTTTTTRNPSGTAANGNTAGTTPTGNTGNRFTANSGNTPNGTTGTGTANGTNASGTTPGSTANGGNASGTTPGNTLSGVANGTGNTTPGTSGTGAAGAQGNEAAQTGTTPKQLANLNDPNTNLKDYSSSGNNTAEVEPTEDKSTETTTNSELEGVVRARGMSTPVKVLLGAVIVLLLGGAGWFFFKRFASEGYTDDDDDSEDDQV